MLLVEQFAAAALNVADYGYVLENGRIAAHGPALQLRNDPSVKAAYLGTSH
jgi:branched-chain amino acid transport system ATP-binding protein